jgi:galactose-1-phosphate uridylyltransferase
MKNQSLFAILWTRLFEKKSPFNLVTPKARSERPKAMPDEDIKDLFQDLHECCDDEDADLKDAIAYSLRILSGQTQSIKSKNPTTALPNLRRTEITRLTEPKVGMQPKSK